MSDALELYGANTGNSLRAAIALEEAAIAYTARRLDLRAREHDDPVYLALNPTGKVPTLVDHAYDPAQVINQSNAIIQYADARAPGRLSPATPGPERMQVFDRYFFFVTDVIAPSHAAFFLRQSGLDKAADAMDERVINHMLFAESFLTETFMAGAQFSMADISAFTIITAFRDRLDWKQLPRLSRWYHSVEARPAVQRGLNAFRET
ncbi:glutathione S-transferase family protein [Pseudomonas vancouverensis]|uniref:Glutathione S-transferase family protein n=1 Tax=Pseudomonas vancouverensis TaxID=95300 RepID=A0A1H2NT54_PSEVA|nr:glutathione S-transferase family protein [Pseudomonas vancouverensis]KAB0496269.1 glutathione S-transferase family protein [Pseudomonas vancouverensis]TDB65023.1 glutathione S-transferase family protein [Pseudomonas vancouverensis]SDV08669.1 GST-like protein [Pseudomonas vancouverensis]